MMQACSSTRATRGITVCGTCWPRRVCRIAPRRATRPRGNPDVRGHPQPAAGCVATPPPIRRHRASARSEEHTSELQSQSNLVCRLLLEKKKKKKRQKIMKIIDKGITTPHEIGVRDTKHQL